MNNIKQLTNFDVADANEVTKYIHKGGSPDQTACVYKVISQLRLGAPAFKLGYCCEVKGINYPIFLTINGIETEFQLGKTGMFEFQPETWKDVNDLTDQEEKTMSITVTEIKVPFKETALYDEQEPIHFVLDYSYEV